MKHSYYLLIVILIIIIIIVVVAEGMSGSAMYELVRVGHQKLVGMIAELYII